MLKNELPKFDINIPLSDIKFDKNIKKVQEEFIKQGCFINNHGKFDKYLFGTVCDYQRKNKLKVTGEIDEVTWNLLFNVKELNKDLKESEDAITNDKLIKNNEKLLTNNT